MCAHDKGVGVLRYHVQDPLAGRPDHGGRDRHFCVGVAAVEPLVAKLEAAGLPYTKSMSGRPAVFFRDPGTTG
jgi:glyoxylase I family protein